MTASNATQPARVLIVDDERALASMIRDYLTSAGYDPVVAHTGPQAVEAARSMDPDVIVLDLALPGMDGVEVARQVRTFTDCYIVMLTARSDEVDKLIGLSVGADDYMTKPFSPRELVARVQTVLRRPRAARRRGDSDVRVIGALRIDAHARRVSLHGEQVSLTRTEFDILAAMSERPTFAWSRRAVIDEVWDIGWVGDEHIVDVHVAHLRRKLGDDPAAPRFIETVRGVGYRLGIG